MRCTLCRPTPVVIQRCMLMTTDPGDLVLDPTCGSGTTAYVAEQWGRRWITIDTSRVAVALARQRILTAKFDYYKTVDGTDSIGPAGSSTRRSRTITLGSIAQNVALDPIFARWEPVLDERLAALNDALVAVDDEARAKLLAKLAAKRARGVAPRSVTRTSGVGTCRKRSGSTGRSRSTPTRTGPMPSRSSSTSTGRHGVKKWTRSTLASRPPPNRGRWSTSRK